MNQEILFNDSDDPDRWAEYYFRLWQKAVEAAKLALADDERCFENTGHHNIGYETREALRAVVTENAR